MLLLSSQNITKDIASYSLCHIHFLPARATTAVFGDPALPCVPNAHSHLDHTGHQVYKVGSAELFLASLDHQRSWQPADHVCSMVFVLFPGWACQDDAHCSPCLVRTAGALYSAAVFCEAHYCCLLSGSSPSGHSITYKA